MEAASLAALLAEVSTLLRRLPGYLPVTCNVNDQPAAVVLSIDTTDHVAVYRALGLADCERLGPGRWRAYVGPVAVYVHDPRAVDVPMMEAL